MSTQRDAVIGKTLKELKIAEDKKALLLIFDDSEMVIRADADCCSETWIQHIELCDLPAKIISVTELDLKNEEKDGSLIQFYGCNILTDKGEIVIDYRNESNGYYGGNLSWGDESHYGGVYGQNNSKLDFKAVGKDGI